MIREVDEYEEFQEITYSFKSMNDFTSYILDIEDDIHVLKRENCSSFTNKNEFRGNFYDCKDWNDFTKGLQEGKKEYSIDKDVFKTKSFEKKFEVKRDFFGSPSVPRTLMGLPKNHRRAMKTQETDYYSIFISFSEASFISSQNIKEYRLFIFDKINYLISEGHAVDIDLFARVYFRHIKTYVNIIITLKKTYDSPDMDKLMFFVCSSDILRRGYFRIMEADPLIFNDQHTYSYGRPMNPQVKEIEDEFEALLVHPLSVFEKKMHKAKEDVVERLIKED